MSAFVCGDLCGRLECFVLDSKAVQTVVYWALVSRLYLYSYLCSCISCISSRFSYAVISIVAKANIAYI